MYLYYIILYYVILCYIILYYIIIYYIPGKPNTHTHNFLVIMGKKNVMNIFFLQNIVFTVMTKKNVISKEHCSPARSKTVFFFDILLKKNVKKT